MLYYNRYGYICMCLFIDFCLSLKFYCEVVSRVLYVIMLKFCDVVKGLMVIYGIVKIWCFICESFLVMR